MRTEYTEKDRVVPGKRRGILTVEKEDQEKCRLLDIIRIIGYKMIPAENWPTLRAVCKQFADALPTQQMAGPLPVAFYNFRRSRLHTEFTSLISHSSIALFIKQDNKLVPTPPLSRVLIQTKTNSKQHRARHQKR
jgi:hypothetical protein